MLNFDFFRQEFGNSFSTEFRYKVIIPHVIFYQLIIAFYSWDTAQFVYC